MNSVSSLTRSISALRASSTSELTLMPRAREMTSAFSASSSGIRTVVFRFGMPSWYYGVTTSHSPTVQGSVTVTRKSHTRRDSANSPSSAPRLLIRRSPSGVQGCPQPSTRVAPNGFVSMGVHTRPQESRTVGSQPNSQGREVSSDTASRSPCFAWLLRLDIVNS